MHWDGTAPANLVGTFMNEPGGVYTQFTINNLLATTNSTRFQFNGYHGLAVIYIDDIDVEGATGVPEPATILLGGAGLACVALLRRQRTKRA